MSSSILSNMFWIPKESLISSVKRELSRMYTYVGKPGMDGTVPIVNACVEHPNYFGVPRTHALKCSDYLDKRINLGCDWPKLDLTYRPGQEDAVNGVLADLNATGGARLDAPTGSGKTVMGIAVAASLATRALILCHKEDLCLQWQETVRNLFPGASLGHVQGDEWDYTDKHVVTCMVQTLYSRRGKFPPEFLKSFDLIITDEGHHSSASMFEFAIKCFPAKYRLGVSATWRRRDGLEAIWEAHISSSVVKMAAKRLTGKYAQTHLPLALPISPKMPWARVLNVLGTNTIYASWLAGEISKAWQAGRRVLVLSDRISQLELIRGKLTVALGENTPDIGMYLGSLSSVQKDVAKKCSIILATYQMMAEGVDVPELDTLFLATPRADIEQSVGRIQRLHDGKKSLLVIDPCLKGHPVFNSTREKRLVMFRKLGFSEQVPVKKLVEV